jgi:tryptophan 2,3-dioxygenase
MDKTLYYTDYLELEKILQAQHPESFKNGESPAHDEMLFIVIHQAFELWFKQILFELNYVLGVFSKEEINDNSEDMNLVLHRLKRIHKIMELCNQQVTVLETMTPLDFLEFRNLLTPASGFQSVQFRLIEASLGLEMSNRHRADYYKRANQGGFSATDLALINSTENKNSLIRLINSWLERMPFFDHGFWTLDNSELQGTHTFWTAYRQIYEQGLTEQEKGKIVDFDYVFMEQALPDDQQERAPQLKHVLSSAAMRSALFIMLYRDFPVFQNSFQILDILVEIDNTLAAWRHAHFRMVRRMIGMRVGTGNTTGSGYLEGAASGHYIFKDIAGLSTYLIERRKLPALPEALIRALSFH